MMLFLKRLVVNLCMFFFILLPLMLFGAVALLFVCPFMALDRLKLPYLFRWFDIVDSYIGRDTSVIQRVYSEGWWSRYCFIAWRNPVNYFDYQYLGLKWDGSEIYLRHNPDEDNVGDTTDDHEGLRHIEVDQRGKRYYEYYLIWIYPFKNDTCLRMRMGHKISDTDNPAGTTSQWCLVFSPFKTFSGKYDE